MLPFFFISLQVVNALTDISEGNTCHIGSGDYSPARSHSCYSDSDFDESEDEVQGPLECEGEIQSLSSDSECIASNSISQMIVRQPPSPPIQVAQAHLSFMMNQLVFVEHRMKGI